MARSAKARWGDLVISIPTFRRNASLKEVLASIEQQGLQPGKVLIIDNDPDSGAASVVENYAGLLNIAYHPMRANSGPAGAFHRAVTLLRAEIGSPMWMLCRGDDNPLSDTAALERLRALAARTESYKPAAIGFFGRPFFNLPNHPCGDDFISVSHIPGGGMATYNIPRLASAGVNFDPGLFFGFEELEIGLKIRSAGLSILVAKDEYQVHVEAPRRIAPWRTYFSHRNRLIVARRFAGKRHVLLYLAMSAYGIARRCVLERNLPATKAVILGVFDGIRRNTVVRSSYIPRPYPTEMNIG